MHISAVQKQRTMWTAVHYCLFHGAEYMTRCLFVISSCLYYGVFDLAASICFVLLDCNWVHTEICIFNSSGVLQFLYFISKLKNDSG